MSQNDWQYIFRRDNVGEEKQTVEQAVVIISSLNGTVIQRFMFSCYWGIVFL